VLSKGYSAGLIATLAAQESILPRCSLKQNEHRMIGPQCLENPPPVGAENRSLIRQGGPPCIVTLPLSCHRCYLGSRVFSARRPEGCGEFL
jgi:hypothetical protein